MLHMAARVIWGPLKVPVVTLGHDQADQGQAATPEHPGHDQPTPGDIGTREISVLIPIAIAVVILGVKPGVVMDAMLKPIQEIRAPLARAEAARAHPAPQTEIARASHP